jgi:hypothetical protein
MRINESMEGMTELERERFLGRLEGMSMAMRICRNRAVDCDENHRETTDQNAKHIWLLRQAEAELAAATIRLIQVQVGSGKMYFGELSVDERAEVYRIY